LRIVGQATNNNGGIYSVEFGDSWSGDQLQRGSNKDLTKAAGASGLFSSAIYYPNSGETGNFGTHDVTTKDAEGKEVVTQDINFQRDGPHVHVDNGSTKKSPKEYTGHTSNENTNQGNGSGTYKKLN
jgi:hypothetical protein